MKGQKILPELKAGGKSEYYDCGSNSYMRLTENVSFEEYSCYCNLLEADGFRLCSQLSLEGCFGKTYSGKGALVQCNYREFERAVRVTVDIAARPPLFAEPCVPEKNPVELIQFETDHSLIDCGMCYIFRLSDGSFFIIDSAHSLSVNDEKRLHALLRQKTPPDEKIVIAGWFFSHGHDDHIEKASDYLKYMCEDTVVEGLYFNFPSVNHRESSCWSQEVCPVQSSFCDFVKSSSFKHISIHSMQRFYVRNLEITVLCTHEDVYPRSLADYNNSSTVIAVKACGTKIIFPGDASAVESDILTSSFSEKTLGCDICQLSHHGHFGCSSLFYEMCKAKLLLIPNTEIKLNEELEKIEADTKAISLAEEYYISSQGTAEISLPYEKGRVRLYPDETTENFEEIFKLWGYDYSEDFKRKHNEAFLLRHGCE